MIPFHKLKQVWENVKDKKVWRAISRSPEHTSYKQEVFICTKVTTSSLNLPFSVRVKLELCFLCVLYEDNFWLNKFRSSETMEVLDTAGLACPFGTFFFLLNGFAELEQVIRNT